MGQSLAAAFYVAGIFPEVAGDLGPSLVKRFEDHLKLGGPV
jgi:hypothetical protein